MTQINKYSLSETDVTSILVDEISRDYLWIAFSKNTAGTCTIKKVSANNPLQKYFDIDIEADSINKIFQDDTYVYLALDDSTLIGEALSKTNPISTTVEYTKPAGIYEEAVDCTTDGTNVYFLTPGELSGENAKIVVFAIDGTYVETIDLTGVYYARAFTFDANVEELWVLTYTAPAQYIRVYYSSGWLFTINY